jgi:RNA polymerase sigma-70 factor (ECF subfamily)
LELSGRQFIRDLTPLAARWGLRPEQLADAVDVSVRRAFPQGGPSQRDRERYVASLHLEDLALAVACALGRDAAWDHFVLEHRPVLYRAADALDPSGGSRDLADSLYAELYGIRASTASAGHAGGGRQSLFRYFHGRSSLATWLRAVLAQRSVDRARAARRLAPLPDEEPATPPRPTASRSADHGRFVTLLRTALAAAIGRLAPRDRLRLACYYAQDLTLAQIGRALGEHEATVSRQLLKARKTVRADVERQLREAGLNDEAIAECLTAVADDPGPLDVADLLEPAGGKNPDPGRSR